MVVVARRLAPFGEKFLIFLQKLLWQAERCYMFENIM
jgi:hypothetical protein